MSRRDLLTPNSRISNKGQHNYTFVCHLMCPFGELHWFTEDHRTCDIMNRSVWFTFLSDMSSTSTDVWRKQRCAFSLRREHHFDIFDRWCDFRESITTLKSLLMCGSPPRPVEKLRSRAALDNVTLIVRIWHDTLISKHHFGCRFHLILAKLYL